jgi:hypothetical protein
MNHDEAAQASLIRKRREMRRSYAASYGTPSECSRCGTFLSHAEAPGNYLCMKCAHEIGQLIESGQPMTEPVSFVDRTPDDEQMAALADHHAVDVQMGWERGFMVGALSAMGIIAAVTVAILWLYK